MFDYVRLTFQPALFVGQFHVTRVRRVMRRRLQDMGTAARADEGRRDLRSSMDLFFINRLQFGFYSVLARPAY